MLHNMSSHINKMKLWHIAQANKIFAKENWTKMEKNTKEELANKKLKYRLNIEV